MKKAHLYAISEAAMSVRNIELCTYKSESESKDDVSYDRGQDTVSR